MTIANYRPVDEELGHVIAPEPFEAPRGATQNLPAALSAPRPRFTRTLRSIRSAPPTMHPGSGSPWMMRSSTLCPNRPRGAVAVPWGHG